MDLGRRLSPGARARWASVLGVAVAGTLAGGGLIGLSHDVLPFAGWPTWAGTATSSSGSLPRRTSFAMRGPVSAATRSAAPRAASRRSAARAAGRRAGPRDFRPAHA